MEFGECLAIILPKLKEIEENHPDNNSNAFRDVVHEWQVTKTTRPFTWDTLCLVLTHIGEEELYKTIIDNESAL